MADDAMPATAHVGDDPPPDKGEPAPATADPAAADGGAPPKVCKDCGTNVKRHWRYKRKGEYYCRACFRRHVARQKLRRHIRRNTIVLLTVLATCLLVLVIFFLADEARALLFWRRPRL